MSTSSSKSIRTLILLCCAAVLSTGCASLFGAPIHNVRVVSDPPNVAYKITDEQGDVVAEGTTPEAVALYTSSAPFQKGRYYVSLESPGYKEQTAKINANISPWYFGNLLFAYVAIIPFLIIDPFTGAMYELPDEALITLEAE